LKVYSILAVPSLLHGCKKWTLKQTRERKTDSRDETRETQSRTLFTRPGKYKDILE